MGKIINLSRERKARTKAAERAQAAANRERFGRTAEQRERDRTAAEADARKLDGAKLEPGPKAES